MGNPLGFIEIKRKEAGNRPVKERISDFGEVEQTLNTEDRILQASRCMDCGVPFCHWACPVSSKMPEWQDAVYRKDWKEASEILHETNDFPEFTGRVCPAPCEKSCVLAIHAETVTIRENEAAVVEKAFDLGYINPTIPKERSGKKIAVVGSGPAGLTVAARLNRLGHTVTLYEKDIKVGGLLRYGIPDFKLNKNVIDRRIEILEKEGLIIKTNTVVGKDFPTKELLEKFNAVCIAVGCMQPRDLLLPGRELSGICFAMDFLTQQNKINAGANFSGKERISAKGKKVVVIGGGDTGSDCVGTAIRQRAKSIIQVEILPKPQKTRTKNNPWPYWPNILQTSSSHEEGCERYWSLATKKFIGKNGMVTNIETVKVDWKKARNDQFVMVKKPNETIKFDTDMVILAMGFTQPVHKGLLKQLDIDFNENGNVKVNRSFQTSKPEVFSVGDAVSGPGLIVTAIASGQKAAEYIHNYLKK
jgi:glutamate synthase (NADPH/NADH) small chain